MTGAILDYTADLSRLAAMAAEPDAAEEVLRQALGSLRGVIPYDLAVVYQLDDEVLRVRVAVGSLASDQVRAHALPLRRFPTIRRALATRRPIPLEEHDHRGEEGDPYDGVLDLPRGHSCMVVPLFAGERSLGLITLDRVTCGAYPPEVVELAGVYAQIMSWALLFAEQRALLSRYRAQLREENRLLREDRGVSQAGARLSEARSPQMRALVRMAKQVADAGIPVLIAGETGTGKELLARAIHEWSPRADGPFVTLNCAALPEHLVESELFGHVKGAFSGATAARQGRFVTANGGTLLLDEIGDMPLPAQAKLLRVLQEGAFEPVGADRPVRVSVRVIAATHVDLRAAIEAGRFREDLYYRLAAFPLTLPPLRERADDLVPLAEALLAKMSERTGRGPWTLTDDARAALREHAWPGNVRELQNALERASILRPRGPLDGEALGLASARAQARAHSADLEDWSRPDPDAPFPTLAELERRYLTAALARTGGRIYGERGAAQLVGLKPTTLQSRLKRRGVAARRHDP
ncbi:MAG: sigma 54-interacting transcriptional regulator [Nannocystaceae bacterium]